MTEADTNAESQEEQERLYARRLALASRLQITLIEANAGKVAHSPESIAEAAVYGADCLLDALQPPAVVNGPSLT